MAVPGGQVGKLEIQTKVWLWTNSSRTSRLQAKVEILRIKDVEAMRCLVLFVLVDC